MDRINNSFVIVPSSLLEEIYRELKEIKVILKNGGKEDSLCEYITEDEAKSILKRKATWFWNLRKAGRLRYYKVGNRTYYHKDGILGLLQHGLDCLAFYRLEPDK